MTTKKTREEPLEALRRAQREVRNARWALNHARAAFLESAARFAIEAEAGGEAERYLRDAMHDLPRAANNLAAAELAHDTAMENAWKAGV